MRCPSVTPPVSAEDRSRNDDERSAFRIPHSAFDRVARQRRLEELAQTVGRLAHDFSNVLTGILGFCELALGKLPRERTADSYLGEIQWSAQQGSELIHRLRLFSRRGPLQPVPTSLAVVARQEETRLRSTWEAAVRLQVNVPADLPLVALDAESLGQVLGRLFDNACEALPGEGSVTLSARVVPLTAGDCAALLGNAEPGPCVEIVLADTGPGLSDEARQRLLGELFFSTKPRHRGLGLAVVYGILHAYRGGLRLEPGLPTGTAVHVFLPVARPNSPRAGLADRAEVAPVLPSVRQTVTRGDDSW